MFCYEAKAHLDTHGGAQNGSGDSPNNTLPSPIPAACQRLTSMGPEAPRQAGTPQAGSVGLPSTQATGSSNWSVPHYVMQGKSTWELHKTCYRMYKIRQILIKDPVSKSPVSWKSAQDYLIFMQQTNKPQKCAV